MCGGTTPPEASSRTYAGLSPRVRGNQHGAGVGGGAVRSIPACAGEPAHNTSPAIRSWVYPRVCGGTCGLYVGDDAVVGLSPRVRGNRAAHDSRR